MTGTRAVIAAVALLLGLSACSGEDPEPKVAPPSPTSPSTTGTSAETPPEMPDAAKGTDAAAAEAFVKFYWEMVNYAQATGDLTSLERLASAECAACEAGVKSLKEVFAADGSFRGGVGTVSIKRSNFIRDDGDLSAVVEFEVDSTTQVVDYPGTSKDQRVPAGRVGLRAVLDPHGESWLMSYWGELQQ